MVDCFCCWPVFYCFPFWLCDIYLHGLVVVLSVGGVSFYMVCGHMCDWVYSVLHCLTWRGGFWLVLCHSSFV